ncbi:MAG: bis(5'-nucleosyl)-tetraphosphatase (symmetrical) YqeK [Dehalococcoidia bacterium]|nr:bis(5'-nucleosyl)-tetraphosphatase (symmetrical) YqeK [Dehalococcoidia bacterium]|tara:strand:- start:2972 stop:3550 length:579 start_codon:yes stop_codon:yes gene_type:complete
MPDILQRLHDRLKALPDGLQSHIYRVRDVALELAAPHNIDLQQAELGALAHDVCRAVPGEDLIRMASELDVPVSDVEQDFPLLLHGPVGAELLRKEEDLNDDILYEAVRWHSTAHASLDPLGKLVFLADKLDPQKAAVYSYQAKLHDMALESLDLALLEFLSREMAKRIEGAGTVHPASVDARNSLILKLKG